MTCMRNARISPLWQFVLTAFLLLLGAFVYLWVNTSSYETRLSCDKDWNSCTLYQKNIFNFSNSKKILYTDLVYASLEQQNVIRSSTRVGGRYSVLHNFVYLNVKHSEPIMIFKEKVPTFKTRTPYSEVLVDKINTYIKNDENNYDCSHKQSDDCVNNVILFLSICFYILFCHFLKGVDSSVLKRYSHLPKTIIFRIKMTIKQFIKKNI